MVSTLTEQLRESLAGVDQMLVDGGTYYCSEEFDDKGGLLASSFQWVADSHLYYVNPQEPVTPEVVRKYSHLKKAEFNVGESQVGLDTGIPLVSDPDDIERIDRDNEGIKYFTGPFPRL